VVGEREVTMTCDEVKLRKEATMTYFDVLFRNSPGVTEKTPKTFRIVISRPRFKLKAELRHISALPQVLYVLTRNN
jgi:hypothetical protein